MSDLIEWEKSFEKLLDSEGIEGLTKGTLMIAMSNGLKHQAEHTRNEVLEKIVLERKEEAEDDEPSISIVKIVRNAVVDELEAIKERIREGEA